MATSVKYTSFTIEKKYAIISEFRRNGLSQADVCRKYNVPFSTFNRWVKNEKDIVSKFETNAFAPSKKRIKHAKYELLESALYKWFINARQRSLPISGPVLMEKASELALKMNIESKPGNGWLSRFRLRHNVSFKKVVG